MTGATIYIVDDDESVREALQFLLKSRKYAVQSFASALHFLASDPTVGKACLLTDIRMPDMDGLELQKQVMLRFRGLPVIIMTGHGDVPLAVRAMRAGAIDFLEKPFENEQLLDSIHRALERGSAHAEENAEIAAAAKVVARLTPREHDVLELLVTGHPNKVIAHKLEISPRTVEIHRVHVMDKMGARTVADLVRKALAARKQANATTK